MEKNYDTLREKGMLALLAFSPIVIGFLFYVLLSIPFIRSIWTYAGPFMLLFYWAWVGMIFQARIKKPVWAILVGNSFGILSLILYLILFNAVAPEARNSVLTMLCQLYNLPLNFLTMWIGIFLDSNASLEQVTNLAMTASEVISLILMIIAFTVGYMIAKNKEKKEQLAVIEPEDEKEEVKAIFSDKVIEKDDM